MKKVIILHGCIRKLAGQFNCSRFTVSDALRTGKPGTKKGMIREYVSGKYGKRGWKNHGQTRLKLFD